MPATGPRRAVSMADIARLAGVSVTTVSHVVNKTRPVAPDTETAVLAAIAETGYIADNVVRSLRTAGTHTVGLAMSSISNPYFGNVVHGLEQAASRAGYSLLLADTHDEIRTELRAVSDLLSRQVEAIVLAPSADPGRSLRHARLQDVPVVLIDRLMEANVDQIGSENVEPTAELVDHLVSVGHRRIAMISGRAGLSTSGERIAGYRLGLRRNRLRANADYLVSGDSRDDVAQRALLRLLALPKPPTALVVANNRMTIGVMRGAREVGMKIPDDMALVAFDDFEWADLFHPRLTVIAQPTQKMGEQALQLVLSRLADPAMPPRRIVMHPTFVHRESCGCT
jgi:LacI family transcriptional regulator, galactose operon repressor